MMMNPAAMPELLPCRTNVHYHTEFLPRRSGACSMPAATPSPISARRKNESRIKQNSLRDFRKIRGTAIFLKYRVI
jgi:hypothetical protein